MVGRLVEQQQVGATHQRLCEVQAHLPAAGEVADRARLVAGSETEATQQARGAAVGLVAADVLEVRVQVGDAFTVTGGLGIGQFALQPAQAAVAVEHVLDRRLGGDRHLLCDVRQFPAGRALDLTALAADAAEDHRQQARLAGAVGAGQADLLSGGSGRSRARTAGVGRGGGDVVELQHARRTG